MTCLLSNMKTGDVGIIQRIASRAAPSKRLADMGFIHGALIEVVKPGFPCIVRLGGACVGLGRSHQASIELHVD